MEKENKELVVEDEYTKEKRELKENLLELVTNNPGISIGEIYEDCELYGDDYEFFEVMMELLRENAIIADSGSYFIDEEVRIKTSY